MKNNTKNPTVKELRNITWIKKDLSEVFAVELAEVVEDLTIVTIWDEPESEPRTTIAHQPVSKIISVIDSNTWLGRFRTSQIKTNCKQEVRTLSKDFVDSILELNHISKDVGSVNEDVNPYQRLINLFDYVDASMDYLVSCGHFQVKETTNNKIRTKTWFNFEKQCILTLKIHYKYNKVWFVEIDWFMMDGETLI